MNDYKGASGSTRMPGDGPRSTGVASVHDGAGRSIIGSPVETSGALT